MSGTGTGTGSISASNMSTGNMGTSSMSAGGMAAGGGITRPNTATDGRHDATHGHHGGGHQHDTDLAPGEESHHDIGKGIQGYALGLAFAVALTLASFAVTRTPYVWAPAIPVALIVFAIAQMGVHLVFFLHLTTGADNTNNIMALAFGILIVFLVVGGSLWIMAHLNGNMMAMPMDQMIQMQR